MKLLQDKSTGKFTISEITADGLCSVLYAAQLLKDKELPSPSEVGTLELQARSIIGYDVVDDILEYYKRGNTDE